MNGSIRPDPSLDLPLHVVEDAGANEPEVAAITEAQVAAAADVAEAPAVDASEGEPARAADTDAAAVPDEREPAARMEPDAFPSAEATKAPEADEVAVAVEAPEEAPVAVEAPEEAPVAVEAPVAMPVAAPIAVETPVATPIPVEVETVMAVAPPPVAVEPTALVPLDEIAPAIAAASVSRRAFLGFGLAIAGGLAGAAGLARLFPVFDDSSDAASPIVASYDPVGKAWTFVVDTASCIGCGLCVVACKEENHVPEEAAYTRTWVERHVVTADGASYVDSPDAGMNGFPARSTAPGAEGKAVASSWFEPRLCMQCENSPCTAVCPVGATYRTDDGVILVDPRRCIGCGYCVVACPYGARYIIPAGESAPNDTPGVADKCTWCYHRISRGAKPACVEACPVGARRFGDASDPDGEIATFVRERQPRALHPEYGTRPRVLYLGPSIEEA